MSGSDIDIPVSVAPRADRPGRRVATKKINYSGLLESEEEQSSDGELIFKENTAVQEPTHKATRISDDESDVAEVLSEEEKPDVKKKPVAKRSRKNKSSSDSEDAKKVCCIRTEFHCNHFKHFRNYFCFFAEQKKEDTELFR